MLGARDMSTPFSESRRPQSGGTMTTSPQRTASPVRSAPVARPRQILMAATITLTLVTAGVMLLIPKREQPHTFTTLGHPILGRASATNEIVLFVDYQCPACKAFETQLPGLQALLHGQDARLVAMQSPFLAPDSLNAALAAQCAFQQGNAAFWRMNSALFARQHGERRRWATRPALEQTAGTQQLDVSAFRRCLAGQAAADAVRADLDQHNTAGFQGTPEVFVNGVRTAPSLPAIQAALRHRAP